MIGIKNCPVCHAESIGKTKGHFVCLTCGSEFGENKGEIYIESRMSKQAKPGTRHLRKRKNAWR